MVVRSFFRHSETHPFTCCGHTHCQATLAHIFIRNRNIYNKDLHPIEGAFICVIFLGRCSYMSPLPIELDFITKKEKSAPYRQTFPSIPKPRKSSVILNNLVEVAVDHAVRLVALTVEGFLVHVLIHIRCTPAALLQLFKNQTANFQQLLSTLILQFHRIHFQIKAVW